MKIFLVILIVSAAVFCLSFSLRQKSEYKSQYITSLTEFKQESKSAKNYYCAGESFR